MAEIPVSVVYRKGPITSADYDEAITDLQNAKRQDECRHICCSVCEDTGHTAETCHHNPLLLARQYAAATSIWNCYHCGFVATNDQEAQEHFGKNDLQDAKCIRDAVGITTGVQDMSDEQWPPNHGLPTKKRFKRARSLKWGETPFDDLTRGELLRLVQAYHSAVVSSQSVMAIQAEAQPSRYWMAGGSGGRALAKCNELMKLAGERDPDPSSEKIYRQFFRSADVLLFPHLKDDTFSNWGINDKGEMCAPFRVEEGYRPIEWRDVLPESNGAVGAPPETNR